MITNNIKTKQKMMRMKMKMIYFFKIKNKKTLRFDLFDDNK